jgi:hypothetical protein
MAKKRATRQAESRATNLAANPPREKRAVPEPSAVSEPRPAKKRRDPADSGPARPSPVQRSAGSVRVSTRPARPQRNRVAIAVLLAVGLLLGFWLLFRLPGTLSHGQH